MASFDATHGSGDAGAPRQNRPSLSQRFCNLVTYVLSFGFCRRGSGQDGADSPVARGIRRDLPSGPAYSASRNPAPANTPTPASDPISFATQQPEVSDLPLDGFPALGSGSSDLDNQSGLEWSSGNGSSHVIRPEHLFPEAAARSDVPPLNILTGPSLNLLAGEGLFAHIPEEPTPYPGYNDDFGEFDDIILDGPPEGSERAPDGLGGTRLARDRFFGDLDRSPTGQRIARRESNITEDSGNSSQSRRSDNPLVQVGPELQSARVPSAAPHRLEAPTPRDIGGANVSEDSFPASRAPRQGGDGPAASRRDSRDLADLELSFHGSNAPDSSNHPGSGVRNPDGTGSVRDSFPAPRPPRQGGDGSDAADLDSLPSGLKPSPARPEEPGTEEQPERPGPDGADDLDSAPQGDENAEAKQERREP